MPPPWTPRFEFYEALLDADRLLLMFDLAAAKQAPVSSHGLRLQIRVQMLQPRADGLRSQEESEAIFALEDRLVPALDAGLDALFVGRFVARGATTFVFMIPEERGGEVSEALATAGDPAPYRLRWLTESDPAWRFYWDFLYPSPVSWQRILNRRVIHQLEARGDRLEVPREVDHWAHLPSREGCSQAASALAQLGYRVGEPRAPGRDAHPKHWTLPFHKHSALDQGQVDEATFEILQVLAPLRGSYDGWGAPVVRTDAR